MVVSMQHGTGIKSDILGTVIKNKKKTKKLRSNIKEIQVIKIMIYNIDL